MDILAISHPWPNPELTPLHHIVIQHGPSHISTPFIGSHNIYLLGICEDTLQKITINYDQAAPPTIEELGKLASSGFKLRFGPSASVFYQSDTSIDFAVYEGRPHRDFFESKKYTVPSQPPSEVLRLLAFDDSVGRVVLETRSRVVDRNLLVLDLI